MHNYDNDLKKNERNNLYLLLMLGDQGAFCPANVVLAVTEFDDGVFLMCSNKKISILQYIYLKALN